MYYRANSLNEVQPSRNPFDALLLDEELYDDTMKTALLNIAEGAKTSAGSCGGNMSD